MCFELSTVEEASNLTRDFIIQLFEVGDSEENDLFGQINREGIGCPRS